MSDIRAPVACEKCGGAKTEVNRMVVDHQMNDSGKVIPVHVLYYLSCADCGHVFKTELPADEPA